jgi:hypothetical protein
VRKNQPRAQPYPELEQDCDLSFLPLDWNRPNNLQDSTSIFTGYLSLHLNLGE